MIDVINLRKSFGDLEILKGINITINKGDIVAVLGPSGSGKSTFLRCLIVWKIRHPEALFLKESISRI